jgi:hypothetical protein
MQSVPNVGSRPRARIHATRLRISAASPFLPIVLEVALQASKLSLFSPANEGLARREGLDGTNKKKLNYARTSL